MATNGVITFCNGTKNLVVVLYNWKDDEVTAEAAAPNQTPATTNPQQTSTQNAPPASPPAAKPPPEPAPPAAKPAPKPGKPADKPPSTGQTAAQVAKRCGVTTYPGPNTTTFTRCSGQVHHAISKTIHDALQKHKVLKDKYKARDNRFVTQAIDKAAHNGYETWHRSYEKQVEAWLDTYRNATPAEFEAYLFDLYKTDKALKSRFPNGL